MMPPAEVDVLIIGCGSAGLTLATQLAQFPDLSCCIVDQKSGPLQMGQADGVAVRTVEMFEAFGFSERALKESYWVNETVFWTPDEKEPDTITRSQRIKDTEDGLSEFPHLILNQARVHDFYLDSMKRSPGAIEPCYGWQFADFRRLPESESKNPLTVQLERVQSSSGQTEADQHSSVSPVQHTIEAKFLVGCDGARSKVRDSLGLPLHGDSANQAWGVMDVLLVTDFPDVRLKTIIHSENHGSVIIIPREGGYMIRLYIEMDKLGRGERVSNRDISLDELKAAARRIFSPFTLDFKQVSWWSVYEIGQRLCERFDDSEPPGSSGPSQLPRVFIAGDACHTHSPKAGQGMNVSMADSFNLGWKLAGVLRGQTRAEILGTYSTERQYLANELIEFDRELSQFFSSRKQEAAVDSKKPSSGTVSSTGVVDTDDYQRYVQKHAHFTAGTSVRYPSSLICSAEHDQSLAKGYVVGTRFHSAPVIRLADAKPMQLGHCLKADGRWRVLLFADDSADRLKQNNTVSACCAYLSKHLLKPLSAGIGKKSAGECCNDTALSDTVSSIADVDSVVDVRAVFPQPHDTLELSELPELLLPAKGIFGLIDYEKAFCANQNPVENIYQMRQINSSGGCALIIRPDQFVAYVCALNAPENLVRYFSTVMYLD